MDFEQSQPMLFTIGLHIPRQGPNETPLSQASYSLFVGRNCPDSGYLCLSFLSCETEDSSAYLSQSTKFRKPCYSMEETLDKRSPSSSSERQLLEAQGYDMFLVLHESW